MTTASVMTELNDCDLYYVDECLVLYTLDVPKSFVRILIKSVDSDIVITATAAFQKIPFIKELRIEFVKENLSILF